MQLVQACGSMGDKVDNNWRPLSGLRNSNPNRLWARQGNRILGKGRKKEDPYLTRPNFNVGPKIIAKPRENFLSAKRKEALVKKACQIKPQERREAGLDLSQAQVKESPFPPFPCGEKGSHTAARFLLTSTSSLWLARGEILAERKLKSR